MKKTFIFLVLGMIFLVPALSALQGYSFELNEFSGEDEKFLTTDLFFSDLESSGFNYVDDFYDLCLNKLEGEFPESTSEGAEFDLNFREISVSQEDYLIYNYMELIMDRVGSFNVIISDDSSQEVRDAAQEFVDYFELDIVEDVFYEDSDDYPDNFISYGNPDINGASLKVLSYFGESNGPFNIVFERDFDSVMSSITGSDENILLTHNKILGMARDYNSEEYDCLIVSPVIEGDISLGSIKDKFLSFLSSSGDSQEEIISKRKELVSEIRTWLSF